MNASLYSCYCSWVELKCGHVVCTDESCSSCQPLGNKGIVQAGEFLLTWFDGLDRGSYVVQIHVVHLGFYI